MLSHYFDRCRTLIERYGGTVEKFIGDAVMAAVEIGGEGEGMVIGDTVKPLRGCSRSSPRSRPAPAEPWRRYAEQVQGAGATRGARSQQRQARPRHQAVAALGD